MNRLSFHSAVAALVVPAAAFAAVAAGAVPASASAASGPIVTDVHTVASFDYATGQQPESVRVNPDRSLTVTMLGFLNRLPPELLRISPSGQQTVLITGNAGEAIGGSVLGRDGSIYYDLYSTDPTRSGIWRIPPGGAPERIAALFPGAFLNGITIDPVTQTLYTCDSLTGTIWSVPASGGTATQWLVSQALAPAQTGPGHLGVNGVTFHQDAVWASNTDRGTLLRIPVTGTGAPGPVQVAASNLAGIDDFNFLSDRSDIAFVPLNSQDEVAVVYPGGRSQIVLTAADGLASPTDTFITGTHLYITDGGDVAPHDSKLQEARINLAALYARTGNQ